MPTPADADKSLRLYHHISRSFSRLVSLGMTADAPKTNGSGFSLANILGGDQASELAAENAAPAVADEDPEGASARAAAEGYCVECEGSFYLIRYVQGN
jgi:hypothetical protein